MLFTRLVLVQMGSLNAQMKDIGSGFHAFYEFVDTFLFTAKLHFSGAKSGSNMSSFVTNFPLAKSIHIWQLSLY